MKYRQALLGTVVLAVVLMGLLLLAQGLAADSQPASPAVRAEPDGGHVLADSASWSSGWITIPLGTCEIFTHNLGGDPDDYVVDLWFLDTEENFDFGMGIHRYSYGGLEVAGYWRGVHWEQLEADTVTVCRGADDWMADQILIRVWDRPTEPDFDSGWLDIDPGPINTLTISHSLGISATDLTVRLWFSNTAMGMHHYGYGGLSDDIAEELHGAYWHHLTENSVQVTRWHDDAYVEQVRVIVVHADPPDYDSLVDLGDWQPIGLGDPYTFTHGLNRNPVWLLVRVDCNSPGVGIHHMYAGGQHDWFLHWQGAYVHSLSRNTVEVTRLINDGICPEARVRIWQKGARVFLPVVVRE